MTVQLKIDERAFNFAVRMVKLAEAIHKQRPGNRVLAEQLLKAGTSVGANVEEAQAGHSKADFIAKMTIAQKESREDRYWLRLIRATGVMPEHRIQPLCDEAESILRIISRIVVTARKNPK